MGRKRAPTSNSGLARTWNLALIRRKVAAMKCVCGMAMLMVFCVASCGPSKQKIGNQAVEKIEQFRKANGRLPQSLSEVGIAEVESGPVYYCRTA